jgi:preprotein translocase subunit Sec63
MIFYTQVVQQEEMISFDPYKILELDVADKPEESEIKKAYRKMSLKWHPDKNPDNPDAERVFVMIAKAYKTLTDEKSRENWEKYGNPDGPQGFSVTIGMPSFLTYSKYENVVLVIYFIAFIIILPLVVWQWWNKAKNYDPQGVRIQTLQMFFQVINNELMHPRQLLEILTTSPDFEDLGKIDKDLIKHYVTLYQAVKEQIAECKFPKIPKGAALMPFVMNTRILIFAYLDRKHIPKELKPHLEIVLKKVHLLLKKMLEIALSKNYLRASVAVVELSQCFTQAMWLNDDPLIQLPFVEKEQVNALKKQKVTSIEKLKAMTNDERIGMFQSAVGIEYTKAKQLSVLVDAFPYIKTTVTHGVPGNDKIVEADIVSVQIELQRKTVVEDEPKKLKKTNSQEAAAKNGKTDEKDEKAEGSDDEFDINDVELVDDRKDGDNQVQEAIAARFPYPKAEGWVLMVWEENHKRLIGFERVATLEETKTIEVKVQAPPKGLYDIGVYIKSDSYRNMDQYHSFKLEVNPRKEFEIMRARAAGRDPKELGLEEDPKEDDKFLEQEEPEGKWYYLGLTSIWELLLVLFILYIAVLVGADWLERKGYIKKNPLRSEPPPPPPQQSGSYYQSDDNGDHSGHDHGSHDDHQH